VRGRTARALLAAALLAALAPAAAPAETRRVEAVGAYGLRADHPPDKPPREAAIRQAIDEAVRRVGIELLPDWDPEEADDVLGRVLGNDPTVYAPRYRIVEDRGERAALFSRDPEAEREYVVLVEAQVDVDLVRQRLRSSGVAIPSGDRSKRVRIVIEQLADYPSYAALRRALEERVGVRAAVPVEMERGRAVLELDADRDARGLMEALSRLGDPELTVTPISVEGDTLVVRVSYEPAPPVSSGRRR